MTPREVQVRTAVVGLGLSLGIVAPLAADAPPPSRATTIYHKSRSFRIPFHIDPAERSRRRELQLWVSEDSGKTWSARGTTTPYRPAFTFQADHDAEYWLAVRTVDFQGKLHPKDDSEVVPNLKVVVDTSPPALTLAPEVRSASLASVRWAVRDANPDPDSIVFEYQVEGSREWLPVPDAPTGPAGVATWDSGYAEPLKVRAAVADRAGNRTEMILKVPANLPTNALLASTATRTPGPAPAPAPAPARPAARGAEPVSDVDTPRDLLALAAAASTSKGTSEAKPPKVAAAARDASAASAADGGRVMASLPASDPAGDELVPRPVPAPETAVVPADHGPAAHPDAGIVHDGGSAPPPVEPEPRSELPAPPIPPADETLTKTAAGPNPAGSPVQPAAGPAPRSFLDTPEMADAALLSATESEAKTPAAGNPAKPDDRLGATGTTETTAADPGANQGAVPPTTGIPTIKVPSPRFPLDYAIEDAGPNGPSVVELWVTRDSGRTWALQDKDPDRRPPFGVNLGGEGTFGVCLIARDDQGHGSRAPVAGDPPQLWVEVGSKTVARPPGLLRRMFHRNPGPGPVPAPAPAPVAATTPAPAAGPEADSGNAPVMPN